MQLSDLLGLRVIDAGSHPVGTVVDVRLDVPGDLGDHPGAPRLLGLVVSPNTTSAYLGYERSGVNAPALIATLLRWRHRGTFVAVWADVARVAGDHVTLRPRYTRYSPVLRERGH